MDLEVTLLSDGHEAPLGASALVLDVTMAWRLQLRGRAMQCTVRRSPRLASDRAVRGVILLMQDAR
jgi:hypothetical protein